MYSNCILHLEGEQFRKPELSLFLLLLVRTQQSLVRSKQASLGISNFSSQAGKLVSKVNLWAVLHLKLTARKVRDYQSTCDTASK